jgi:hypothetical protein
MTRILADLPDGDIKWLDQVAEQQGKSRAAILREAVSLYRGEQPVDGIERFFGMWKNRADTGNAFELFDAQSDHEHEGTDARLSARQRSSDS